MQKGSLSTKEDSCTEKTEVNLRKKTDTDKLICGNLGNVNKCIRKKN